MSSTPLSPRPTTRSPRRARGLSLIESMMTLTVIAVASGSVLPSFQQSIAQRRIDGAAAQLHTDLQLARSLAVAQNRSLRVSLLADAGGSCYVVHSGSAGDCRCGADGVAVCNAGAEAFRAVHFPAGGVQLQANVSSMVLDAAKGTVSPTGTLRLVGNDGRAVHVVVNLMGRTRQCTPANGALPGYPQC